MTKDIIFLADKRKPVIYTVTIAHYYDGAVEVSVHDVADDERSRASVGYALRLAAEAYLNEKIGAAGDAMLAIMLANIDHAMGCTHEAPAVIRVDPDELASWNSAVQEYEAARFPAKEA